MPQRWSRLAALPALFLLVMIGALSGCQSAASRASSTAATGTPSTATSTAVITTTATRVAAVKLVQRSAQSDKIPVGKIGTVVATCQPGEQLLSGGYYVYAFEAAASVVASYPSGQDAWTVTDDNTHGPSYVQIIAYANCLQAPYSVGMRILSSTSQPVGNTFQETSVACPSGAVITGGGFQAAGGVAASMPTSRGWRGVLSGPGKVFALCATQHAQAASARSASFTTQNVFGPPQNGEAQCEAGQVVTGGGYSFAQGQTFIAMNTLASDASRWEIGVAGSYDPVSVTVWAACVIVPQAS